MVTYNITFIVEPSQEDKLIKYLKEDLIPEIITFPEISSPSIRKVIEAGGEKPSEDHGLSIALSIDLPSEEKAHLWHDHTLLPNLNNFQNKFGNQALFFITLLENL